MSITGTYKILLDGGEGDVHSEIRAKASLHRGVEVGQAGFEWRLMLTPCPRESRAVRVGVRSLHRGDEVGEGRFELWAHTHCCSMVEKVMSTARSERRGQLQRGDEVGHMVFERPARTQ